MGIPAVALDDVSGYWTTAEAVDVLLCNRYLPKGELYAIKEMLQFLLNGQSQDGGWPMSVGSPDSSTMATGHAVAAFASSRKIFCNDDELIGRIEGAQKSARDWLHHAQNESGGWGVEPSTEEGSESRTIATCYALRGYFASEQDYDTSRDIRHAVNYLVSTVNKDGGWGQREGLSSDPSNTARVISTLLESGQYTPNHTLIERAQSYILHSQDCWRFRVE